MRENKFTIKAFQFSDISHFTPNSKNVAQVVEQFTEFEMLPMVFGELTFDNPTPTPVKRLRLFNDDSKSKIDFELSRVEFLQTFDGIPFSPELIKDVTNKFCKFQDIIKSFLLVNSSRYSLVCNFSLVFESRDEFISTAADYISNNFLSGDTSSLTEFTTRFCRELSVNIQGRNEVLNFVKSIVADNSSPDSTDEPQESGVKINYDINTSHKNTEVRFTRDDFCAFITQGFDHFLADFSKEREQLKWK